MKGNTKGFTLVELLAVIVILALIALITLPIILGIINDARKGAAEDSAYGAVKAVELAYARADVGQEVTVTFGATITDTVSNSVADKISLSGDKPTSGQITIKTTGDVTVSDLVINGYTCKTSTTDSSKITCSTSS